MSLIPHHIVTFALWRCLWCNFTGFYATQYLFCLFTNPSNARMLHHSLLQHQGYQQKRIAFLHKTLYAVQNTVLSAVAHSLFFRNEILRRLREMRCNDLRDKSRAEFWRLVERSLLTRTAHLTVLIFSGDQTQYRSPIFLLITNPVENPTDLWFRFPLTLKCGCKKRCIVNTKSLFLKTAWRQTPIAPLQNDQ